MLYSRQTLSDVNFFNSNIYMQRYINKISAHPNELRHLKWHEQDFLFKNMKIMRNTNGKYSFDLLTIPEAKNYELNWLILIYGTSTQHIDFNIKVSDYMGEISPKRKIRHQQFFVKYLQEWFNDFMKASGIYYSIMKPMYEKKMKELFEQKRLKIIDAHTYTQREIYTKACFFHIYYNIRLYFDELNLKAIVKNIDGFNVYGNIYTYSHVLNRHYFPYMNKGLGTSINDDIPGVDLNNLPNSLLNLIDLHSKHKHLEQTLEYLLFKIKSDPYILWIKYGKIAILQNRVGFEIRSFYKCSQKCDLVKYNGTTDISITDEIVISI